MRTVLFRMCWRQGLLVYFFRMTERRKGAGIYVSNTLLAMQKFAAWYRSKLPVRIIGITGSVGKTTTKEMIAAVLETKYRTVKTYKNLNSQIGVALMMFELDEDTELAVIEMGISMPGEMDRLVEMVKPECAVLTNIGVSHMEIWAQEKTSAKKKERLLVIFRMAVRCLPAATEM